MQRYISQVNKECSKYRLKPVLVGMFQQFPKNENQSITKQDF